MTDDNNPISQQSEDPRLTSLKHVTTAVYALQAASFLVGVTFLVALIINYVKRPDVAGTYLESHFTWQIRTFWYGLLWGLVGFVGLLLVIGYLILLANMVWVLYRVVKGWLKLYEGEPVHNY
jgi:uncharacterized membrane protein